MSQIGIIGLGVMGKNIAQNMLNHNFTVSGFNRSFTSTKNMIDMNIPNFSGYQNIEDFIQSLELPRRIFLMVPAGKPVDDVLENIVPLLQAGDIIMDGGNSFFKDTNRRVEELAKKNIHFFGVGVSGGEEGALKGPSIMPSGEATAYQFIQPILEAIAAKKDNAPCCTYIGPMGSGHYVKMVHNGIEYADMQLLAETYLILKYIGGYTNAQIADILTDWNQRDVQSYLVEITIAVLREKDNETGHDLIDIIRDIAGNKGTGRWTSIEALAQEFNASLLTSAYQARIMSNQSELRSIFQTNAKINQFPLDLEAVYQAYALAKMLAFAQGFALYKDASNRYHWNLNYAKIASIFRAGCIIQAKLLQRIMDAYHDGVDELLHHQDFQAQIFKHHHDLRNITIQSLQAGLAIPVFTNAMIYLNQLSATSLGANMIQGQRDFFGAHTYQRIDREGFEHHIWSHHEE